MNKARKLNPILKSVIVMSCIAVVCAVVLALANNFLRVTDEKRFARSVSDLIECDKLQTLYGANSDEVKGFNATAPDDTGIKGYVIKVYLATGGDAGAGKYIIEGAGLGFGGGYVKMLVCFNTDGVIYSVSKNEIPASQTYAYKLDFSKIIQNFKGKSGSNIQPSEIAVKTGATATLGGVTSAVNIASEFFKRVILGEKPVERNPIEVVENAVTLSRLDAAIALAGGEKPAEYLQYTDINTPFEVYSAPNGQGRVLNVFTGGGFVILDVRSDGYSAANTGYGSWSVYIVMDGTNTVAAINYISCSDDFEGLEEYEGISVNPLDILNSVVLTNYFKGKTEADILAMTNPLPNTTGATETNNGIKSAVYCALKEIGGVKNRIAEVNLAQEEAQ